MEGDHDDSEMQKPENQVKYWKSNLIRSGQGSFLQPQSLINKVELAMAKYGL